MSRNRGKENVLRRCPFPSLFSVWSFRRVWFSEYWSTYRNHLILQSARLYLMRVGFDALCQNRFIFQSRNTQTQILEIYISIICDGQTRLRSHQIRNRSNGPNARSIIKRPNRSQSTIINYMLYAFPAVGDGSTSAFCIWLNRIRNYRKRDEYSGCNYVSNFAGKQEGVNVLAHQAIRHFHCRVPFNLSVHHWAPRILDEIIGIWARFGAARRQIDSFSI